jgi:hypothetical protein
VPPVRARAKGLLGAWLVGLGCSSGSVGGDDDTPGSDAGPPPVTDAAVIDAARPPPPDAAPPPPTAVRFVAMGDTGEGNADQKLVADAILAKCAADGCDFVLLLGDNVYDSGVDGVDDPQWQTKFEEPYQNIDLPFYAVLGNHDYGGTLLLVETAGMGNEFDKGPIEVAYSAVSDKWTMPATHYTFRYSNVGFIALDTNSILWDNVEHGDQRAWYATALMELAGVDWIIAAGHHPLRSNGTHGNAGAYESIDVGDIEIPIPVPILDGAFVKSFLEEVVCGTVDVYLSGHDHNRQWLDENAALCGAELVVSGAGAKTKELSGSNAFHWQESTVEGFLYVVIEGDTFTGELIDKNGVSGFTRSFTR